MTLARSDIAPLPRWRVAVAALRAPQWLHFCLLPLAGLNKDAVSAALRGAPLHHGAAAGSQEVALASALGLAMAVSAGCLAWAYGLNAVAEQETDASARKNPLIHAPEATRQTLLAATLSAAFALLLSLNLGPWAAGLTSVSLVGGGLYSFGLAAKRRPGWGLLFNASIFVPLTGLLLHEGTRSGGWGEPWAGALPADFLCELTVFSALLLQNQLVHEVADADEDARAGSRTTARVLGPTRARQLAVWAGVGGMAAGLWLAPTPAQAGVAAALMAAGSSVLLRVDDAAEARRTHRVVALLGGAALWLTGWCC